MSADFTSQNPGPYLPTTEFWLKNVDIMKHYQGLKLTITLVATVFLLGELSRATPQQISPAQDETTSAIALYQRGQYDEAIQILRDLVKRDNGYLGAWHYLGLALGKKGEGREAAAAHEKAARLGEELLDIQLSKAWDAKDVPPVLIPIRAHLQAASESADRFVSLNPYITGSQREDGQLRLNSLRGFAEMARTNSEMGRVFRIAEVTTKPQIVKRPSPEYTPEARKHHTTGKVELRVVLSAYGKVIAIHAVTGLPNGLTESAIRAARQLKFFPAMKDGHPVSTYATLEYHF